MEKESIDIFDKYESAFRASIICLENETSIVDLVPWSRQILDILNMALAIHRSAILGSIITRVPEPLRPKFFPTLLGTRSDISTFTYVSEECISAINAFLAIANSIAVLGASQLGPFNRYTVGIIRASSIVLRSQAKNGFYIDRRSLIGILREIKANSDVLLAIIQAK